MVRTRRGSADRMFTSRGVGFYDGGQEQVLDAFKLHIYDDDAPEVVPLFLWF